MPLKKESQFYLTLPNKISLNEIYKENGFEKNQIIEDYHKGYNRLVCHMEDNKENMAVLKADAIQMERAYSGLLRLDHKKLYFYLYKTAPKAIFALLTRDLVRELWIAEGGNDPVLKHIRNTLLDFVKCESNPGR